MSRSFDIKPIVVLSVVAAIAATQGLAEDRFSGALEPAELATHRAGDFGVFGNENETLVAKSQQTVTGSSEGNSISATHANAGDIAIGGSAFSGARGINNLSVNAGHNATVQGIVSLSVVLKD